MVVYRSRFAHTDVRREAAIVQHENTSEWPVPNPTHPLQSGVLSSKERRNRKPVGVDYPEPKYRSE
jgi:hypothetical protein